jgi:outer membrane receptor protein involved in Fe transport
MKFLKWTTLLLALFAMTIPALFGQGETTGSITGVIRDASGATIPNATITLTNKDTGSKQVQTSSGDGQFNFNALNLGNYELSVEAAGFRKFVQESIVIHVNDRLRIEPSMQVGQQAETVTVTSTTVQVETEKPTLSGLVNETQVRELPLPNRNFMGLALLVPGVTLTSGREISMGGLASTPISINGSRQTAVNYMVDGARNTDTGSNATVFNYPSVDAIGEFRILTNSYDAQFGRNAGGIINVIVKSGTRDFHGAAYEFDRNDKFAARDALQFTRPISDRDSLKTPLRYNDFGWTLGGPFFIPKIYPKSKSKTFFFFSEEWRKTRGFSVLATDIVPTADQLNGIFTTSIKDPTTGNPFPNNTIPAGRIDPNAQALIKSGYFPAPNLGANQFRFVGGSPTDFRQELLRVDHDVTDNWRLMVRYIHDQFNTLNPTGIWSGSPLPGLFPNNTQTPATNIVTRSLNILNPHMLNEFQFDYATNAISSQLASTRGLLANVPGFKVNPIYPNGPQHNQIGVIPGLGISGITTASPDVFPFFNENPSFTWQDNFTWSKGKHEFKFGGLYSSEHKNENAGGPNTNGSFNFNGNVTGNGFADFLLGRPNSYSEDQTDVRVHVSYKAFEWYAQDTWKVTPRFTAMLGLRWSYYGNPTDDLNILASFVPGLYNPANAVKLTPSGSLATDANGNVIGDRFNGVIFPKGLLAGHDSPWGRKVQNDVYSNYSPRVGFAWDPTGQGKWSIRAGYGIYFDRSLVGIIEQNGFSDPLANASVNIDNPSYTDPRAGAPRNAVFPIGITSIGTPFKTPRTQQFNFNVQRELGTGSLLQVAYAGSSSDHQLGDVFINQPQPTAARAFGNQLNQVRPYIGFASITDRETRFNSNYNALQTLFRQNLSDRYGVVANIAYTYSKVITNSSGDRGFTPQNDFNLSAERGPASYDRTHVLTPSIVWTIPYSHSMGAVARQLMGGWEIASIMNFWSGTPLTVSQSGDPIQVGGSLRPNVIGTPTIHNSNSTRLCYIYSSANPFCAGLSGADAFQALTATATTFGNSGRGVIRGPGVFNIDLAAYKSFIFRENGPRLQFRAEAFNALNHMQLNNPGTNVSTSSFGQITSDRGPRIIQLGLKFLF